jgi:Ca2+-binding RTX toxin-like protein
VTLTASATITDFDGDTAAGSQVVDLGGNVRFADDGPAIDVHDLAVYRTIGTTSGVYDFQVGADDTTFDASFGPTALQWTNIPAGFTFALEAGSNHTYAATFDDNGTTKTYFEITINPDETYSFNLVTATPSITVDSGDLLSGITGGSQLPSFTFPASTFDGAFALELTATSNGAPATLTISSTDLGINGDTIQQQANEVLKLDVQQQPGFENATLESLTLDISSVGSIKAGDQLHVTTFYTDGSHIDQTPTYDGSGHLTFDTSSTLTIDYILLSGESNNINFKITGLSLEFSTIQNPADDLLHFNLTGQDFDSDTATAGFTVNVMAGTSGDDHITTGSNDDQVSGGAGNDTINAGAGNDVIIGGAGADNLTGGPGNDTFKYLATTDSTPAAHDVISDFGNGSDVIDFTAIAGITHDAQFIAPPTPSTTVAANSIVYFQGADGTHIVANASNVAEPVVSADMLLVLTGVNAATLSATTIHHA